MTKVRFYLLTLILFLTTFTFSQTFERQIITSSDDAEEKFDGTNVETASSDIEMVYDSWNDQGLQILGLRFDDIIVPSNSTILNAYIQFTADGDYDGDLTMTIKGENNHDSAPFADTYANISSRSQTTASVIWNSIPAWIDEAEGSAQRTPDLSSIISEIIDLDLWESSDPITLIITGTGGADQRRRAYSFDENSTKAAVLHIEYEALSDVDLALTSCITPGNPVFPDAEASVQVEITSFGNFTATDYELSYSLDGAPPVTQTGTTPIELAETILFTFDETIDISTLGTYDLDFTLTITDDEDLGNNTLSKTINVIEEVDILVFDEGSAWRFWDNDVNPGADWNTVGFDDTDWPVGYSQFGFGDGDESTLVNPDLISYYFRKKINVADPGALDDLYLHLIHDDAAIVYINDEEVLRTELMPLGVIGHFTTARQRINSSIQNDFFTYKIDPSYFVAGENIIAISIRNRSDADGDISFDCFVSTSFTYDQDGPYVYYVGDDILVEEVTPAGLISNTYATPDGLELTCSLPHMGTSFSFFLKSEITVEPSVFTETPSKFLAISDFDGHIEGLTMVLRGEGIIDEEFNWIYGDGHLIISGDLFDRGFHITECMWLLYKLESEAIAAGGRLHLIIGNHEMFNMRDDWRYVETKYFNDAHLMDKRMLELYDSNTELGRWLRSKNIIEKIGNYAFMHGGISPEVADLYLSYDQINNYGRQEMSGEPCTGDCDLVNGSDGIYWYRGMVEEDITQAEVDEIIDIFNVKKVILGHTKDNTIRSFYNDKVIAIDMYHIDNFEDGFMEALQFELGCFYLFHTDGIDSDYTLLNECDDSVSSALELNGDDQLQIYPNPTSSILNIKTPVSMFGSYNYSIYDETGKIVIEGVTNTEMVQIDMGNYSAGKYILTLRNEDCVVTGHFILKK